MRFWPPVVVVTSPYLEPGLDARLTLPDTVPAVMPWPAPPQAAVPDSAAADTTALPFDPPEEE